MMVHWWARAPLLYASIWRCRGFAPPEEVDFKPTLRCNLKCKMCFQRKLTEEDRKRALREELPTNRYLELLEELSSFGVKRIHIVGGGEPLMRNDILEIMEAVKRLGLEGVLTTNGTLLDESVAHSLVDMGWDVAMFSVDAPTPEAYGEIRGSSRMFERVLAAMSGLTRVKRMKGAVKPLLHIHCVVTNLNYDLLEDMVDFAHNAGAQILTFDKYYPEDPSLVLGEHEILVMLEHLKRAAAKAKRYGLLVNVNEFLSLYRRPPMGVTCYRPWLSADINHNGDVVPCCYSEEVMGNVRARSFREVWNGEKYNQLRKMFRERRFPDFCKDCFFYPGLLNDIPLGRQLHALRLI
ncbi:MAG: radical SAM protein [Candidatus Freyarchaeota archaeon]|nr:radical SAM protein [Candidatus Jordarchaeia archaeon]